MFEIVSEEWEFIPQGGFAFQPSTSCFGLPGRLRALRCIHAPQPLKRLSPFSGPALRFKSSNFSPCLRFFCTRKIIHFQKIYSPGRIWTPTSRSREYLWGNISNYLSLYCIKILKMSSNIRLNRLFWHILNNIELYRYEFLCASLYASSLMKNRLRR